MSKDMPKKGTQKGTRYIKIRIEGLTGSLASPIFEILKKKKSVLLNVHNLSNLN